MTQESPSWKPGDKVWYFSRMGTKMPAFVVGSSDRSELVIGLEDMALESRIRYASPSQLVRREVKRGDPPPPPSAPGFDLLVIFSVLGACTLRYLWGLRA